MSFIRRWSDLVRYEFFGFSSPKSSRVTRPIQNRRKPKSNSLSPLLSQQASPTSQSFLPWVSDRSPSNNAINIWTDASSKHAGGHLGYAGASSDAFAYSFVEQDKLREINYKELQAILQAIVQFRALDGRWRNRLVIVPTDNDWAARAIGRMIDGEGLVRATTFRASGDPANIALLSLLRSMENKGGFKLHSRWIYGRTNTLADHLSHHDWHGVRLVDHLAGEFAEQSLANSIPNPDLEKLQLNPHRCPIRRSPRPKTLKAFAERVRRPYQRIFPQIVPSRILRPKISPPPATRPAPLSAAERYHVYGPPPFRLQSAVRVRPSSSLLRVSYIADQKGDGWEQMA